jgi:stage II sporulation protein D
MLSVAVFTVWPSQAAVPTLDQIRVGIFLNLPGKYTTTVPAATFSSPGGLDVGTRLPSGTVSWFQTEAGKQTRFGLDDYKAKMLETSDFTSALAMQKQLQKLSGAGFIFSLSKGGKTVYQVTEGSYASAADAKAAADRFSKDGTVARLIGKGMPELIGPYHLEGGVYGSLADARKAAQTIGAAGVDAFVAVKNPDAEGGTPRYSVLVGAAVDSASLAIVKAAAAKTAPADSLRALNAGEPYMLLRDDHTLTGTAQSPVPLYAVPSAGVKVWLSAQGSGGIKLNERYNRTYRGSFEVSGFNNRLAVVNELPFEQYLYSVVGGEMPSSWPIEALKAQAVTARGYALYQGFGFKIAHVVDSVLSQAYGGTGAEKPNTIAAVDATKGEVALYGGKLIETVFSSSAGGASADASEVWGSKLPYLTSVPSPDQISEKGLYTWYRIALPDSRTGYIREDLLDETGEKTSAGSVIMRVNTNGSLVRPIPLIQSAVEPVAKLNSGDRAVVLEKAIQSNEFSWVRGPFTADALLGTMKKTASVSGPVGTLEEGGRGPSGRVVSVLVNGQKLPVKNPDLLRSALGGLPSTRFDIEETGRFAMVGGGGQLIEKPNTAGAVYIAGADGKAGQANAPGMFVLNGSGPFRRISSSVLSATATDTASACPNGEPEVWRSSGMITRGF